MNFTTHKKAGSFSSGLEITINSGRSYAKFKSFGANRHYNIEDSEYHKVPSGDRVYYIRELIKYVQTELKATQIQAHLWASDGRKIQEFKDAGFTVIYDGQWRVTLQY